MQTGQPATQPASQPQKAFCIVELITAADAAIAELRPQSHASRASFQPAKIQPQAAAIA